MVSNGNNNDDKSNKKTNVKDFIFRNIAAKIYDYERETLNITTGIFQEL